MDTTSFLHQRSAKNERDMRSHEHSIATRLYESIIRQRGTMAIAPSASSFRLSQAIRQCDHLFALLSLVRDADEPALDPDYEEPLNTIVQRYSRYFIEKYNSLDLLYHCNIYAGISHFPSWIPDWTAPYPADSGIVTITGSTKNIYSACAGRSAKFRFDPTSKLLSLKAVKVDIIDHVGRNTNARDLPTLHRFVEGAIKIMESMQGSSIRADCGALLLQLKQFLMPLQAMADAMEIADLTQLTEITMLWQNMTSKK